MENAIDKVESLGSKLKNLFYVYVIPIVVATNTFNIIWNRGTENAQRIEYNEGQTKRRITNAIREEDLRTKLELQKLTYENKLKLQKMDYENKIRFIKIEVKLKK